MPNTHHDKKNAESHSTEIRAYAAIKVRSLEMVGSYEIVLDKDSKSYSSYFSTVKVTLFFFEKASIELKSTHSIIVASYVWKSTEPANGINLWNRLFEEHDIVIKQVASSLNHLISNY